MVHFSKKLEFSYSMVDGETPQKEGDKEYIRLKVVGQDANEVYFRVKYGAPMGKLKKSYADRAGVSVASLRYAFPLLVVILALQLYYCNSNKLVLMGFGH